MYFVMDDLLLILQDSVENPFNFYEKQAHLELPKVSGLNNFLYAWFFHSFLLLMESWWSL